MLQDLHLLEILLLKIQSLSISLLSVVSLTKLFKEKYLPKETPTTHVSNTRVYHPCYPA